MSDENFSQGFGTPYQAIIDHLEAGELKFRAVPEHKAAFFSVRGEAALYDVWLLVTHDDEVFQINMAIPVAPKDKRLRPLVEEVVTRANHNMVIGHFDFDLDDVTLRYHIGHTIFNGRLEDETIGRLIATALETADRYFPAFMRTMFGGHTPADAVYLSELDYREEAAEDAPAALPSAASPPVTKPPAPRKKIRRPRRDPRLRSTQELPGLLDRQRDTPGENGGSNPSSTH